MNSSYGPSDDAGEGAAEYCEERSSASENRAAGDHDLSFLEMFWRILKNT